MKDSITKITHKINHLLEEPNSKKKLRTYSLIDFNNLLVGAFLMLGVSLAVIITTLTFKSHGIFDQTYHLFVDLEKGLGLSEGTSVQINGVKVGSIDGIMLRHGGGVKLRLKIKKTNTDFDQVPTFNQHITENSIAYAIRAQNIIASRVIYITQGETGRVLQHMDNINSDEAQDIETLLSNVASLLKEVHFLVNSGKKIVSMASNPSSTIGALLHDDKLYTKIKGTMDNLDRLSTNSNELVTKFDKKLVPLFDEVGTLQIDLRKAMKSGQSTLGQADSLLQELRKASTHAPELMKQIEGLLIEGRGSMQKVDEIFENIESSKTLGPILVPARDSLPSSLGEEQW